MIEYYGAASVTKCLCDLDRLVRIFIGYLRAARIFSATAARCFYRVITKYVYYWYTE